jgi:hypothetical protein
VNQYVITYNSVEHGDGLLYDYETIKGKTPKEALKKHFNREFKRLTGDAGRYADVILIKGYYDEEHNIIRYTGRYQTLCYGLV